MDLLLQQLKGTRHLGPSTLYKAVRNDGVYAGGCVFNTDIVCTDEAALPEGARRPEGHLRRERLQGRPHQSLPRHLGSHDRDPPGRHLAPVAAARGGAPRRAVGQGAPEGLVRERCEGSHVAFKRHVPRDHEVRPHRPVRIQGPRPKPSGPFFFVCESTGAPAVRQVPLEWANGPHFALLDNLLHIP